jgi:hypothetical protein
MFLQYLLQSIWTMFIGIVRIRTGSETGHVLSELSELNLDNLDLIGPRTLTHFNPCLNIEIQLNSRFNPLNYRD